MPLSSDGNQLFPVSQTNSYGRTMLVKQMETHDHVICRAPAVVGDRVAPIYMKQMKILHKAERFRPSYNIMKQRHDDDIVMANLIRDARCTSENQLDGHILRFRELRQKHPNHMPGWLEQYEVGKSMEIHEDVVKKARKWIDNEPPKRALHYRTVLRRTKYTKGGFPRTDAPLPKMKKKKKKKKGGLLPGRRASTSLGFSETDSPSVYDGDNNSNTPSDAQGDQQFSESKPDWALEEGDEALYDTFEEDTAAESPTHIGEGEA